MKLNFTSLEYFRKAAKMEHLTKAAEALHIAQPALSRTIRGLEEELGVTLFEREGKKYPSHQRRSHPSEACGKFPAGI